MRPYRSENPATGELYGEFPTIPAEEIPAAITRAAEGYRQWRATTVADRAGVLKATADLIRERQDELAALATEEMGKPLAEARGEVDLVASIFEYYATQGPAMLDPEKLDPVSGDSAWIQLEPVGVLLGIMPWNYPYYQVARFAAPNLLLGNTLLLKHARNCPRSALAIEAVLHDAGVPAGAYLNLFADSSQVEAILSDDRVQGVSLTGSEQAGAAVGSVAGRLMKKMVLELGGSDPFLVLEDADIERAASAAVTGRMTNAGQACTASKRLILTESVYDQFLKSLREKVSALTVGDPIDPKTDMGPLSSAGAVDELQQLVDDAVSHGAHAVLGGSPLNGKGYFYPPTILTGVTPAARAYREELFGPVAVVYRVPDVEAAIDLANDSPFGLGASVFTSDLEAAEQIAARIDAGMVTINGSNKSQPDLPFGGVKRSGVGRELGRFGIEEFANKKLVRRPAMVKQARKQAS
ncbi:NAD-dependent succinate-semialdehyde dehydrogenase [Rhodococcus koreensis]